MTPPDRLGMIVLPVLAFILRRILQSVAVMAVVAFIAFALFNYTGDPVTFIEVGTLLIAVAAIAGYIPAWKASRIDPMVALRSN